MTFADLVLGVVEHDPCNPRSCLARESTISSSKVENMNLVGPAWVTASDGHRKIRRICSSISVLVERLSCTVGQSNV